MPSPESHAATTPGLAFSERSRLAKIERTLRHAQATQRTETDSWLNAYQDDVSWLVSKLREHTDDRA